MFPSTCSLHFIIGALCLHFPSTSCTKLYHCLQNIFLRLSQNITIPLFALACLSAASFNQLHCIPLVHQLHIALTIDLSALLKVATSFSRKNHVSFPYNIADLTYLLYTFIFIRKENLFPNSVSLHSEFLPSCSCSHCWLTSSTGIQPIAKIAKSLHSFDFITHYLLLHFSRTICRFIWFTTNKKSCRT